MKQTYVHHGPSIKRAIRLLERIEYLCGISPTHQLEAIEEAAAQAKLCLEDHDG